MKLSHYEKNQKKVKRYKYRVDTRGFKRRGKDGFGAKKHFKKFDKRLAIKSSKFQREFQKNTFHENIPHQLPPKTRRKRESYALR
ncbi:hypothetical protein KA107_03810 [Candidatus Pacearchaeota archaeon]|nr:hypothetical protein [Candidatus Pacearchaeota archaeon]